MNTHRRLKRKRTVTTLELARKLIEARAMEAKVVELADRLEESATVADVEKFLRGGE